MAAGSAIGLAVYMGVEINLFKTLTGPAEFISLLASLVLLALVLAGLVVVVVDTSRIHRADEAVRARAKGGVSHHPVYAHAHRYPPRHRGSWVFVIVMLIAMTSFTVVLLPAEVNSWAYVTGVEHQDTFNPVSYEQTCNSGTGRGGFSCQTVTEGYLSTSGAHVTWGSQVPLGQPFSVRDPLWNWGRGRTILSGESAAITNIIAGLFFDGVTLLLLYVLVVVVRDTSSSQRQHT